MRMDINGNMYYIKQENMQCIIMLINPRRHQLKEHIRICEIRSAYCRGFDITNDGMQFYFFDETKSIQKLVKKHDRKML